MQPVDNVALARAIQEGVQGQKEEYRRHWSRPLEIRSYIGAVSIFVPLFMVEVGERVAIANGLPILTPLSDQAACVFVYLPA